MDVKAFLKGFVENKRGGMYMVALAIVMLVCGGLAYATCYYSFQQFYAAIQPSISLSDEGSMSLAFSWNLWGSIPLVILLAVVIWLFTVIQRRKADEF